MSSHEHLERGPWRGEKWWVTLRELGISRQLTEEQLEAVLREVKRRSLEKKGPLTDEEFVEIVNSVVVTV